MSKPVIFGMTKPPERGDRGVHYAPAHIHGVSGDLAVTKAVCLLVFQFFGLFHMRVVERAISIKLCAIDHSFRFAH